MMEWLYVSTTGERLGATDEELAGLARNGAVLPTTLLWSPGASDWQAAAAVKPELFAAEVRASTGLQLGRATMEPLWQRRGWLLVLTVGLLGVAVLRSGVAAAAAWPDGAKLAGVAASFLVSAVVAAFLLRWWRALGQAARAGGLHEARLAAKAGGHVLLVCGGLGLILLLLTLYDLLSLLAHSLLNR